MSSRIATIFVCDDILVSLNGKWNALGIYTADIIIAGDEVTATQIIVVFQLECDLVDPYTSITVEVQFPGEPARQLPMPILPIVSTQGRSRWTVRWPFLNQMVRLRPGRIQTKVIHDKGEIDTGGIWIINSMALLPEAQQT
jgi:hypothetical protein